MSLVVWLPMTKDLRNQGLADVTVTNNGATFNSNGKLGGCYYFDGSNDYISTICTNYPTIFSHDFSMAFWTYSNDDGSRSVYLGNYGLSGGGNWFNLEKYTNDVIRIWWNNGSPDIRSTVSIKESDGWIHICVTRSGNIFKIYKNGVLTQTISNYTISNDIPSTATTFYIGTDYRTSSDIVLKGKLNDFRIYDHCLSPMEIKQISQGLVLHYPLDNNGWGQENQLKNSNFSNGTNSWYGVNSSSIRVETKDGYTCGTGTKGTSSNIIGQTSAAYTGGTTIDITISAKVYVTEAGTLNVGHWITTTQASGWQSMSGSRVWNTTNSLSVGWNYISTTLKNATNQYTGNIVTAFGYTGTTFWITDIKLEFGEIATPWCPNSSDELATTMGMNDGIEYDCSGFGNNGIRAGEFSWSSDTPRYLSSMIFEDDCSQYIHTNHFSNLTQNITMSCWVYQTSATATSGGSSTSSLFIMSQGRDYDKWGFGIRTISGVPNLYITTTSNYQLNSNVNILNGWHHLVATYDGLNAKIYVDGILKATQSISGDINYIYDSEKLVIGKMSYGYTGTTTYFPFVGKISDCRVYATALSADDVKSLYQNSAYIDSSGNVYGAVHSEV